VFNDETDVLLADERIPLIFPLDITVDDGNGCDVSTVVKRFNDF
jgi:hypothetical protein